MKRNLNILFLLAVLMLSATAYSQSELFNRIPRPGASGGSGGKSGGKDSLVHRTGLEDSITINFRYLDSSRYQKFDSTINDFNKRYLLPADYLYLGNIGNAAKSLLFSPILKPGWDAGFHAYDVYMLKPENNRFFSTTRPYTELGYLLGSKQEQLVQVLHTQNINPNWNFSFNFRLLTSPGYFKNQNTAQTSYQLNSFYQSPNRRYHLFFYWINNTIKSAENGGFTNPSDLDDLTQYKDRKTIPVRLGAVTPSYLNPLTVDIQTGTTYKIGNVFLRQQYDLGKKDSVQTDSVTIHLFYPKLRIEHNFQYNSYSYNFKDPTTEVNSDTSVYRPLYNFFSVPVNFMLQDKWNEMVNDISVYQFPDAKNPQQFIKVGASLQNLTGTFDGSRLNYHNTWVHGEYRNKTRNQKWDAELLGELYTTGLNFGDYGVYASLKRYAGKKIGYLQVGFQNVNRTPSFIFNSASSFNLANVSGFNKENTTRVFASIEQPAYRLRLLGSYFLLTNYSYFSDYYHAEQHSGAFNLLQIQAEKEFRLTKHLQWIAELVLQQRAGDGPVNVPLVYTRNRIGYLGSLGFPNLLMAAGLEFKYNTAFKADGYSPLLGQFYYQDTARIALKTPVVNAYLHFRIKRLTFYVRAENLNTVRVKNGFGFTNNNLAIARYPYPTMQIHVGITWSFVN